MTIEQALRQGITKLTTPWWRKDQPDHYVEVIDYSHVFRLGLGDMYECRVTEYNFGDFAPVAFSLQEEDITSNLWEPWEPWKEVFEEERVVIDLVDLFRGTER